MTAVLDELPEEEESKVVIHNHIVRDAEKEDEDEDDKKKKTEDAMDSRMTKMEDAHKEMSKDIKMIKDKVMKDESEKEEEEEDKKKKAEDANTKIEGALEEEAPPGTNDAARKARDSAYLEDSFSDSVALAEIIAPGVSIPTFDKKLDPGKTYDTLCKFRRTVLDLAYGRPETRGVMDEILGGNELSKLNCSRVRDVFRAVGVYKKNENNRDSRSTSLDTSNNAPFGSGASTTAADINKRNAEFYK
jgi:hypothetical protein